MKAPARWRRDDAAVLRQLMDEKVLTAGYLGYGGSEVLRDRGVDVLPLEAFARRAARGDLFS